MNTETQVFRWDNQNLIPKTATVKPLIFPTSLVVTVTEFGENVIIKYWIADNNPTPYENKFE